MSGNNSNRSSVTAKQIGAIVLIVLVVVFILENTHHTKVRFIVPQTSAPLWLALLLSAVVGAAAGALFVHRRSK